MQLTLSTLFVALSLSVSGVFAVPPPDILEAIRNIPSLRTHIRPPGPSTLYSRSPIIRPAVCSSNPNSPLYCGPKGSSQTGSGIIRPAVCSSNPNSPLYCPGTNSAYYAKRDAQFRAAVCSDDPRSPFYCRRAPAKVAKRSPFFPFRCLNGSSRADCCLGVICSFKPTTTMNNGSNLSRRIVSPCMFRNDKAACYAEEALRRQRFPYVAYKKSYMPIAGGFGNKRGGQRKPRMMVCSWDKKSPNYCRGAKKDDVRPYVKPKGGFMRKGTQVLPEV